MSNAAHLFFLHTQTSIYSLIYIMKKNPNYIVFLFLLVQLRTTNSYEMPPKLFKYYTTPVN